MSNRTKKKKETKKKKKEKTSLYGHLGKALFILEILGSNDGFKLLHIFEKKISYEKMLLHS
jgi:hypothetical protein